MWAIILENMVKDKKKNVIKESDDLKHFEKTLMTAFTG